MNLSSQIVILFYERAMRYTLWVLVRVRQNCGIPLVLTKRRSNYSGLPLAPSQAARERKRGLGTPQTPAGEDPCTPLGNGFALKLTPMGVSPRGVNLSGSKGRCPLDPLLFLAWSRRLQARKRKKEVFGDTPNPGRGTPA